MELRQNYFVSASFSHVLWGEEPHPSLWLWVVSRTLFPVWDGMLWDSFTGVEILNSTATSGLETSTSSLSALITFGVAFPFLVHREDSLTNKLCCIFPSTALFICLPFPRIWSTGVDDDGCLMELSWQEVLMKSLSCLSSKGGREKKPLLSFIFLSLYFLTWARFLFLKGKNLKVLFSSFSPDERCPSF